MRKLFEQGRARLDRLVSRLLRPYLLRLLEEIEDVVVSKEWEEGVGSGSDEEVELEPPEAPDCAHCESHGHCPVEGRPPLGFVFVATRPLKPHERN